MIQHIYEWTLALASHPHAEWALTGLAFAESSFFPIPPDVVLIPMAAAQPNYAFWFALICSLGSLFGGLLGYLIGYYGGQALLHKFLKAETILRVENLFNRYDAWAIGIAGFTPIPYKVFTLSSGAFRINLKTFIIASFLGRAGRFFLVAGLLYFFGEPIREWIEKYLNIASIVIVLLLVLFFVGMHFFKKRAIKKAQIPDAEDA